MATKDQSAEKGAYALLIKVEERCPVTFRGQAWNLPAGWYVYCGSAKGPGGLGARLRRHIARDKRLHWHIDQLTSLWGVADFGVTTTLSECDLVDLFCACDNASLPIEGFGSSDCRTCAAHLIRLRRKADFGVAQLRSLDL